MSYDSTFFYRFFYILGFNLMYDIGNFVLRSLFINILLGETLKLNIGVHLYFNKTILLFFFCSNFHKNYLQI